MLVSTPSQDFGGFFSRRIGVGCDKVCDRDISGRRPNGYQCHFGTLR
jgi:hypothetical protein